MKGLLLFFALTISASAQYYSMGTHEGNDDIKQICVEGCESSTPLKTVTSKGSCSSSNENQEVIEKIANVSTKWICLQTALGVYAWIALH